jgi:hypothetical protein
VRKYSTADLGNHDGIYISSKLGGKENLNSADCEQEIYQALAIEVETGVFEQVWSENGRVTNGAEVQDKYFTVQDDRIQININEDDFNEYQNKYSTLQNDITLEAKLCWFDSAGNELTGLSSNF